MSDKTTIMVTIKVKKETRDILRLISGTTGRYHYEIAEEAILKYREDAIFRKRWEAMLKREAQAENQDKDKSDGGV